MVTVRRVEQIIQAHDTKDGADVKIKRVAGFQNSRFSPFLMIDELKSDDSKDNIGGFPPHPHRGIETLTYLLQGHFQHKDHMGNVGEVRSGGAQWMAAGRGVIHSEMPMLEEGRSHGFQIWINQPASMKMTPAQYLDMQPDTIVEHQIEQDSLIRVIAGTVIANDVQVAGTLNKNGVPLVVADWRAEANKSLTIETETHFNAMVYIYKGTLQIEDKLYSEGQLVLLSQGEQLKLASATSSGALLFSGEPIDEPVVHYGPFVMNSMEEIEQTIHDFNSGVFERY